MIIDLLKMSCIILAQAHFFSYCIAKDVVEEYHTTPDEEGGSVVHTFSALMDESGHVQSNFKLLSTYFYDFKILFR